MQLSCFSKLAAFRGATRTKKGTSSGVWHWLTLSKRRDHSVGGQPLLQQQYYVKIPHFSVAITVRVSDSQRCVSRVLQLQKQILQSVIIPGGGALPATFQAHQSLTSSHVYVICSSHVPVDDWPLSAAVVPKLQLPPHSNHLPNVSSPLPPRSTKPWPSRRRGHGPLSVSCAACQQDIDWGSSGPWGVRAWGWFQCECSIGLGSGEFGGQVGALGYLSCSSNHSWMNHSVAGRSVAAPRGHVWCPIMFIWVIYISVKIHMNARMKNFPEE